MACMLNLSICHCKRLKLVTTDLLRIDIYRNLTWVCTCSLCSFLSGLREQVVSMCKHIKTAVSWLYLTLHKYFEIFLIKEGGITVQVGQTSKIPLPLLFFHKTQAYTYTLKNVYTSSGQGTKISIVILLMMHLRRCRKFGRKGDNICRLFYKSYIPCKVQ